MPPRKEDALTAEQVGLLRAWIDAGAPWPEGFVIRTSGGVKLDEEELAKLPPPAEGRIDFVRDVQPIFAERCYGCHGPHRQEVGFRLDHKPSLDGRRRAGPGACSRQERRVSVDSLRGRAAPRRAHAEEGIAAFAGSDRPAAGLDRSRGRVSRQRQRQAARCPRSLGFQGAHAAGVAEIAPDRGGAMPHPIDAFIGARLEKEGLSFSPEADKLTLLRRLHLDLVGLPPTPEEIAEFEQSANRNPQFAIESVVERLLASPHYGERWARHWLDAARYADSDGFEKDKPRIAHFYRDWVSTPSTAICLTISSSSSRSPATSLQGATQDQIVATGYLRNSMLNEEGGVDPEQFRMEAMFDRMDALGKGILGLGLNCCQCHTHKYDPFTHEDYYRLFAFLNNDHEAQPRVYSAGELMQRADVLRQIGELEAKLQHETPDWQSRMAALGGRSGEPARSRSGPSCGQRSTRTPAAASAICRSRMARSSPPAISPPRAPA